MGGRQPSSVVWIVSMTFWHLVRIGCRFGLLILHRSASREIHLIEAAHSHRNILIAACSCLFFSTEITNSCLHEGEREAEEKLCWQPCLLTEIIVTRPELSR